MGEQSVLHATPGSSLEDYAKGAFLTAFSLFSKAIDPLFTESDQLTGMGYVLDAEGKLIPGPLLWLLKHESWYDAITVPTMLLDLGVPDMKVPNNRNHLQHKNLSRFLAWLKSPLYQGVYRTWLGEGTSEEQQEEMRTENRQALEKLREGYATGQHIVIFPEGTTETDGRISEIKSGAYNLAKVERSPGVLELVRCVPVGVTYDLMAGDAPLGFKRDLVFFNIGGPFLYEPVARPQGETDEEWVKRDIHSFEQRIFDYLLDLNVYTTAQLAGEYVLRRAEAGERGVSAPELERIVRRRAEALGSLDGIVLDHALLDQRGLKRRVERFATELELKDYSDKRGRLDHGRILAAPEGPDYKDGNVLLYSANRLRQVMELRPEVAEAIESAG